MKLSFPQQRVIKLMREGYELGHSTGFSSNVWLQLGGCGKGGKSQTLTFSTFHALIDRDLISTNSHPFARPVKYHLTELGKTIEL